MTDTINAATMLADAERLESQFDPMPDNSTQGNGYKYDLSKYMVDFDDNIPEPEALLKLNDILVLSRGNVSTIKGKAKSRKSFFVTLLIEMIFNQNADVSVLIIDTEQSKSFVFKALNRVYRLMNWKTKTSSLKCLSLRECDVLNRREILVQAMRELTPDVVMLDGGVDIIADFNNAQESKEVAGLLMTLSTDYNCHLINVLHEGKTNGELRGHFGAEMLNKSETVFEIVKDGEQSAVKPYATRNRAFDEFTFMVDEFGLPRYVGLTEEKKSKADQADDAMKLNFIKLLRPSKVMEYQNLANEYLELAGCSDRTAKSHIAKMVGCNFIRKLSDKSGYCLTTIVINKDDDE